MAKNPRAQLQSLESHPALAETASQLFYAAALESSPAAFLKIALPLVCQALGGDYLALVKGEKGKWRVLGASGPERPLPQDLLAEVLDDDRPQLKRQWYIAALAPRSGTGEVLAAYRTWLERPEPGDALETLAGWLQTALAAVRERERQDQRMLRLQAILEIAARWQQTHEMQPLLEQMAATSTRLLHAERATIFLWDRAAKLLIGRPAMGVEGNELRIPDHVGIVGQCVHTGQPRRVDVDVQAEQQEVDRRVDQQLKFHTRSLLCVPLRGRSGELFGAFEVINKIGGN